VGLPDLATLPATVGELWIMSALVIVGVRDTESPTEG